MWLHSRLCLTTKFSHKYTKLFAKSAQAVTGPSKKCEEYFRKAGVYKPVSVIPNPVDLEMFNPQRISEEQKRAFRKKYGYTDNDFLGVFVGRLGREKSVDILLRYWQQAIRPEDHIRLLIVGDGPVRPELEELARSLGIDQMVTFAGKVLHEDMPPYVAACDFYITTSTSDTNSISMLEGMATGLPVLQIVDPLNEGQVRDGVNGYIFSDAQDMAAKIQMLRDLPADRLDALRASTRASVEQSGAVDLAQYVLKVYHNAFIQKQRKRLRMRRFRLHFRIRKGESSK